MTNEQIEQQLRQALQEKANSVMPSADGRQQIENKLGPDFVGNATVTSLHQPRPIVRYLAMAAASVAVVGVAGYLALSNSNTQQLDLAVPSSTTLLEVLPAITTSTTTTSSLVTETSVASMAIPAKPLLTGPVAATKELAAEQFLALVGITEAFDSSESQNGLSISRVGETQAVVELEMTQKDNGWAVVQAQSYGVTAQTDSYPQDGVTALAVTGEGRGFEANLGLQLVNALDGSLLSTGNTQAGSQEVKKYQAQLKVQGTEAGWVVVSSDGADEGALIEFAAVPVSYNAAPSNIEFGVFRIESDDPDQGLNLRSGPGGDEPRIKTLPAGTKGIVRQPTLPVFVDDSIWWQVKTAEGTVGWAHSSFLTAVTNAPLTDVELLSIGQNFANAAQADSSFMLSLMPWSTRVPVSYAWLVDLDNPDFRFMNEDLTGGTVWDPSSRRDWAVPEATFGQQIINQSHWDFLQLRNATNLEIEVGDGSYAYPFEKSMADSFLPNVRTVVISQQDPDGIWRAVHLFVESTPQGGQIVAIGLSFQQP